MTDIWHWDEASGRLLHPTQVLVLEVMRCLDQPVTVASLVEAIDDSEISFPVVHYHLLKLTDLEVLRSSGARRVAGATEGLYVLRPRPPV